MPTAQFDFGPYAQILKAMLPRARGIYLYAPDADLLWSADGADLHDLRPVVETLLEAARQSPATSGVRHMLEDAPSYCFVLRDELGAVLGVTALVCRAATREADLPALESVERTLGPLLSVVRRDLGQQRILDTGRFNIGDTEELQWLLEVTRVEAPTAGPGDGLQALLDAFVARTECDVALLHFPGRRLERVVEGAPLAAGELDLLRTVVRRHLLRVVQLQQKTLIVNKVRESGPGGLAPFRMLCVPLSRRGQVHGVVVAFNRAQNRAFAAREARMLERLAPRLLEVIDVRFDGTTGLLTRHAFDEQVAALVARAPQVSRWLVYADLDRLHAVNDLYGFAAGDAVLRAAGEAWREQPLAQDCLAARIGSDRFVALLEDTDATSAAAWAEDARRALASLVLPAPTTGVRATASLGVAALVAGSTLEHGLAAAEAGCREAKRLGRNRVEAYTPSSAQGAERRGELRLQQDLLEALDEGRLALYAQPVSPLWDPSRGERYEILVRLIDAHGAPVPAERFVLEAGRNGLIGRVDEWVLGEIARRLGAAASFLVSGGTVFTVNLSQQSVQLPDLATRVATALAAAKAPAACLGFEIDEGLIGSCFTDAERTLAGLHKLGCRTSVDHFGSGATSLAYLKALPINELKIDGSFIQDVMQNPRSESLVRAILQIARQLELDTVAECVESQEAATHLATLGVTYGQGNALGAPRPLAEVLDALARRSAPRLTDAVTRPLPDKQVH